MSNKLTVIGHADLISNFAGDLQYLTLPQADAQVTMAGLKSLRPLLVLASLCPYDYETERAWAASEAWQRWMSFRTSVETSPSFRVITAPNEVSADLEKIQLLLHLEGADILERPEDLEHFVALGGKALALTWNAANQYAGGAFSDGQLTDQGRELLGRINELGLMLDLSHLNEASFWGVLEVFDGKVFASHSNVHELADSPRNLTRRQLHALRERMAWVGVSFARSHLTKRDHSTIADVVAHIEYLKNELGPDLVGLGTDFGGILSGPPKDLESLDKLPNLFEALTARGWTADEISLARGESFVRFFSKP